jgi:chemotaxis protein methyltransferase CheR
MSSVSPELSDETFQRFLGLIHAVTGITVSRSRKSMVEGRLRRRLRELGIDRYERYFEVVRAGGDELLAFIDAVTTNETQFFRTPRIWTFIEQEFLPRWFAAHPGRTCRIWSAAASSGEEAHSLAIACELFRAGNPGFAYRILGTDISREMVARCEQGLYGGRSLDGFRRTRPEVFARYMLPHEEQFRLAPEPRAALTFRRHNLFEPLRGQPQFDLVLLRNVLIYFTPADQQRVLARVETCLADDAALVIGESESLASLTTGLVHVQPLVYGRNLAVAPGAGERVA